MKDSAALQTETEGARWFQTGKEEARWFQAGWREFGNSRMRKRKFLYSKLGYSKIDVFRLQEYNAAPGDQTRLQDPEL